jgi:hypothetical protein
MALTRHPFPTPALAIAPTAQADPSIADGNKHTPESLAERTGRRNSASLIHSAAVMKAAQNHHAAQVAAK